MTTTTYWSFVFGLTTPEGFPIIDEIEFHCELSGQAVEADWSVGLGPTFEDVECTKIFLDENETVPLPADLKPYFDRWLDGPGLEFAIEALFDALEDERDAAAEYRAEQREADRLEDKWEDEK